MTSGSAEDHLPHPVPEVGCSDRRIEAHLRTLRDCNQRGGRLLSLVDLLGAGTVDLPVAGYLAAMMRRGSSLIVGAQPGGAGKTAVMVALLNLIPDDVVLRPIEGPLTLREGLADTVFGQTCYLAHEIGKGWYYAYLWDEQARAFFRLAGRGHLIASNLHADTLEEAQAQLCDGNGVAPDDLRAVVLKVFLRVSRGADLRPQRRVNTVYESDGEQDRLVWQLAEKGRFARMADSRWVSGGDELAARAFLERRLERHEHTIEEVRLAAVQEWMYHGAA
ncbi:MAG: hypothetical protein MUF84_01465 [Anaerolineae bacterium]|nr:hypothetical protein [Anaerolineae bacterium]